MASIIRKPTYNASDLVGAPWVKDAAVDVSAYVALEANDFAERVGVKATLFSTEASLYGFPVMFFIATESELRLVPHCVHAMRYYFRESDTGMTVYVSFHYEVVTGLWFVAYKGKESPRFETTDAAMAYFLQTGGDV